MKIQNMDFWNQLALRPQIALWRRPTARRPPLFSEGLARCQADGKRPSWEAGRPVLGLFLRTSLNYSKIGFA